MTVVSTGIALRDGKFSARRPLGRAALGITLALGLSGCAIFGGTTPTADTYELRPPAVGDVAPVRRGTQILIAEPAALRALDSQDIVIRTEPLVIQYLSDAQWSDRLPRLVQTRLGDAFQAAGRFDGVGLPGQGLAIDYQLVTEIQDFGADARTNRADVMILAKLLDDRNGTVVAQRSFEASVPVRTADNAGYVAALDGAFSVVASEMVSWVADLI